MWVYINCRIVRAIGRYTLKMRVWVNMMRCGGPLMSDQHLAVDVVSYAHIDRCKKYKTSLVSQLNI